MCDIIARRGAASHYSTRCDIVAIRTYIHVQVNLCLLAIFTRRAYSSQRSHMYRTRVYTRVVKVFAMGVITMDFTMFLPGGKNTFGHGNKWQKLNFGIGWVLSAVFL